MSRYNFFVLDLVFLIPGVSVFILRRDLRKVVLLMSLFSLPFAFTEFLFYPTYWEPTFIFDLADKIGFGIEDFLFVFALAAFSSTAYPFVCRKRLRVLDHVRRRDVVEKVVLLLGSTLLSVIVLYSFNVPMIYGAPMIMLVATVLICRQRQDLLAPAETGGILALVVYAVLSWIYLMIYPEVFRTVWHIPQFSGVFLLELPLEELTYGLTSGMVATVFYPYVFNMKYVGMKGTQTNENV